MNLEELEPVTFAAAAANRGDLAFAKRMRISGVRYSSPCLGTQTHGRFWWECVHG